MNPLPMHNEAGRPDTSGPVLAGSTNPKQRGVVLFLTLIALLAMSLAAVALIRSVDTSAMILGNLAFKESARNSADAGFQGAINEINAFQAAYVPAAPIKIENDPLHPLSRTNLPVNPGYYSNVDPALLDTPPLFYKNPNAWQTGNRNVVMPPDGSGNTVQYIIQRMCRYANTASSQADCLYGVPPQNADSLEIKSADSTCVGCPKPGQSAQTRVTVKSTNSTGAVSYVQGFIY
jgi:type IV pilus assembly protein PilX